MEGETETSEIPVIHHYWSKIPETVTLAADEEEGTWTFLTSISIDQSDAESEFEAARDAGGSVLLDENVEVTTGGTT